MGRKNIFQRLAELDNIGNDIDRMDSLFTSTPMFYNDFGVYKLTDVGNFLDWKNRGHCLDVEDYLKTIQYKSLVLSAKNDNVDSFLTIAEIILNFYKLAEQQMENDSNSWKLRNECYLLYDIITDDLERLNHKTFYNAKTEQVFVVEDNPATTAVAEMLEIDLASEVVRYNRHLLKGDIDEKGKILACMGKELEPKRKELKNINKRLSDNIFFMLNKLNIRHNNLSEDITHKNTADVADMNDGEIEDWYDELYQMILLGFLELNQQERNKKIKKFKDNAGICDDKEEQC